MGSLNSTPASSSSSGWRCITTVYRSYTKNLNPFIRKLKILQKGKLYFLGREIKDIDFVNRRLLIHPPGWKTNQSFWVSFYYFKIPREKRGSEGE